MITKIKLCGMTRKQDIETVNVLKPEFCGFIVEVEGSRRSVDRQTLKELTAILNPDVCAVGVFVNAQEEFVAELLNQNIIGLAQLHGNEDEAYIKRLRELTEKPLMKAFSINCKKDIEDAEKSTADYILLDHGKGGSGASFDWSLLQEMKRPFFLAGGLGEENIKQALTEVNPWAVDLSSGLETDGYKDAEKMKRIVEIVRTRRA